MGNPPGDMSQRDLMLLLKEWSNAVEKPIRAVEELGPEKRVEFDVRPRSGGGAAGAPSAAPPTMISQVPSFVDKIIALLKIQEPRRQEHDCGALTIYGAGGILVVFAEWRIVITTPQRVHIVRHLLRILTMLHESGYETEWFSFVRKNNDSPWMAKDQQIAREFSILKSVFPTGRSYIFGAVDQDHYFYYIYDDVKRDEEQQRMNREAQAMPRIGSGAIPAGDRGRHGIEDNVQFNLKMYGVRINGAESKSLQRFGLGDLNLEAGSAFGAAGDGSGLASGAVQPGVAHIVDPAFIAHRPRSAGSTGGGSTEAEETMNNSNNAGNRSPNVTPPVKGGAAFGVSAAAPAEGSMPRNNSSTSQPQQNNNNDDAVAVATGRSEATGATPVSSPHVTIPDAIIDARLAAQEKPASPLTVGAAASAAAASGGRKPRKQDELAVEVITQASRFLYPDQYETIRIMRDVKGNSAAAAAAAAGGMHTPAGGSQADLCGDTPINAPQPPTPSSPTSPTGGAPRYVATYETTIDALDETKESLTALVRELEPERFTIIALADPYSPAAVAVKKRVPIGVEPQLYPGYTLVNRTMNRFAFGYQIWQFTYSRPVVMPI